jgi:flagellar assembly protein FliH
VSLAGATVTAWALPAVEGPLATRGVGALELPTTEHLSWERGFAAGRDAGVIAVRAEHQAATQQLQHQLDNLQEVLDLLARPLAALSEQVEEQLTVLAVSIARAVVRRELKVQPEAIIALVRDTVSLLPLAARDIRVHLHPEEAAIVRERLAQPAGERAWTIVEDPVLSRGGCEVRSNDSSVDARVEQRLGAAIAAALGEERCSSGRG